MTTESQTTIGGSEQFDDCGNRCRDFDEDCYGINDKLHCWKYDPTKGVCPFLTGDVIDE
jgi:hypothetical protein